MLDKEAVLGGRMRGEKTWGVAVVPLRIQANQGDRNIVHSINYF